MSEVGSVPLLSSLDTRAVSIDLSGLIFRSGGPSSADGLDRAGWHGGCQGSGDPLGDIRGDKCWSERPVGERPVGERSEGTEGGGGR